MWVNRSCEGAKDKKSVSSSHKLFYGTERTLIRTFTCSADALWSTQTSQEGRRSGKRFFFQLCEQLLSHLATNVLMTNVLCHQPALSDELYVCVCHPWMTKNSLEVSLMYMFISTVYELTPLVVNYQLDLQLLSALRSFKVTFSSLFVLVHAQSINFRVKAKKSEGEGDLLETSLWMERSI